MRIGVWDLAPCDKVRATKVVLRLVITWDQQDQPESSTEGAWRIPHNGAVLFHSASIH